jgi:PAS domain S-box-containing protein
MHTAAKSTPASLRESVIVTHELDTRPSRAPQHALENQALLRLMDALAATPDSILQRLAATVAELCRAGSAGISLLEPGDGDPVYRWRAVSGAFAQGGAPGPQPHRLTPWVIELGGTQPQLFRRPGRLFPELDALPPRAEEILMMPLAVDERVIGTVWAVHHRAEAQFDREDARLLERLAGVAAVAWRLHESAAALREQQTQTALALEATGVGVFRYDARSGRQVFSPRLLAIWGLGADEEPTPERIRGLVHPEDSHALEAIRASLDPHGPGRFALEHRIVRPDGELRWVRAQGQAEFEQVDGTRRARRCVGTMLDVTDSHRANEALLESRARFATLVEALPQLVWSARANGYTDYLSPQWLAYTGQSHEQAVGFGWKTAVHPEDAARAAPRPPTDGAPGGVFESELRLRGADGQYRWFLVRATAMKSSHGQLTRWYGTCTDIDLARRVQDELARREAQLELATQVVGAGVFDHDYSQGTLYWSPRLREIHELPPEATPSLAVLDAQLLPEDRPAHMAAIAAVADPASSGAFTSEYRVRRRDGEVRWILARAQTWFDGTGAQRRPVRTLGVEQDITDQKRIEAALRESQQRFVALADSVPVLAWTTTAAGDCDYLNKRWYEYTGQSPAQAVGAGWFDAVHPDDHGPISRLWERSLRSGEPLEAEYRLRRHDGAWRWFSARATAQRAADGRIDRWFGTSSDVDEIRRLVIASENVAQRLRLATEAAQAAARGRPAQGRVPRDARARAAQPARADPHAAHVLGAPQLSSTQLACLVRQVIQRQVAHMAYLLDDLLDVARITRGKLELRRETASQLPSVVETAIEAARPSLDRRSATR